MPNIVEGCPSVQALEDIITAVDNLIVATGLAASDTWTTIKTQLELEQDAGGA